jgi:phosphopantothenoylcysteine decarboxylase/phosphopantothenate--cysteine ligase
MLFEGKKVLITAGPTQEAIDPVRYISNHSSGKMGFAIAESLAKQGAEVKLIAGPTQLTTKSPNIEIIDITSAEDMYQACHNLFDKMDIGILAAAVADYTPKVVANQKIKKNDEEFKIELVKTKDILKSLGQIKTQKQTLVGFALETNNEIENATKKLQTKNCDFIVLNSLANPKAGFGHNTNMITIINKFGEHINFELKSKVEVAKDICQYLNKFISAK